MAYNKLLCFKREMSITKTFCKSRYRPRRLLEGVAAWNANLFREQESEKYETGAEAPSRNAT